MANYSCTTFGCSATTLSTAYSSLALCDADCVGWGCPDSIAANADIYFVYDSSLSFDDAERVIAMQQANQYLAEIGNQGWVGKYHHIWSTTTWLHAVKDIYFHHDAITDNPSWVGGTSSQGYDAGWPGATTPPPISAFTGNTVVVVFSNEENAYHDSTQTMQEWYYSWWGNYAVPSILTGDRQEYKSVYDDVYIAGPQNAWTPGTLKAVLIPVSSNDPAQAQAEQNFILHAVGLIDSGNQNQIQNGGSGTLDGTWIMGTSPMLLGNTNGALPELCLVGDTSIPPSYQWGMWTQGDGLTFINNLYAAGTGGLDQIGWHYDPTFGSMSASTLHQTLYDLIGTVSGTSTICVSAQTMWSGSTEFPSSAQTDCNLGCFGGGCKNPTMSNYDAYAQSDCAGNPTGSTEFEAFSGPYGNAGGMGDESCCWDDPHECTWDGCQPYTPAVGGTPQFNTQADCETGCTSFDCTSSGCSLFNIPGNSAGSGYLGTGGTYTTSGSCTGTCVSYNCGASGCLEQTGTGGTYSTSATCTASCYSYTCTATGCEPAIVGSGGTYYDITNHQDGLTACTAACQTWDCTNYGCVLQPGSGGAYNTLNTCSAACQSWECATSGCQAWNSPSYTTAQSYVNAPGGQSGQYGTGGTATQGICAATCKTWSCAVNGCVDTPGNLGPWDWDEETDCNLQCTSYNCGDNGCVIYNGGLGTGGTYNSAYPLPDCEAECGSYNCAALTSQPTTANAWSADSCTYQLGTGGTFYNPISIALSEDDCQTGCTSWSCQEPNVSLGCIEYPNTGNTLSVDSYNACTAVTICQKYDCTATGCVLGNAITGTYNSLTTCTASCQSWACTTTGCSLYNFTGTSTWTGSGHLGTGGTYDNSSCDYVCTSWNCTENGCHDQDGTGGTYTLALQGAYASDCKDSLGNAECDSWDCSDSGCEQHNINPIHSSFIDGLGGSGGTYSTSIACGNVCTSWYCDTDDCYQQAGTGGTYTTYNNCTGTCETWNCGDNGCSSQLGTGGTYNSEIECTGGTAANLYLDGCTSWECGSSGCDMYNSPNWGTGGTFSTSASCENGTLVNNYLDACTSWNCANYATSGVDGCLIQGGTGGTFSTSATCSATCLSWQCQSIGCYEYEGTGATYTIANDGPTAPNCLNLCDSFNCTDDGCQQHNTIYPSNSWYDGNGGSGGTFTTSNCDSLCTSWNCDDFGCTSQTGTGGTFTTYNNCTGTCETWNCEPNGCIPQDGTGGTFTTYNECTAGTGTIDACTSWNCTNSGCDEQIGTGGTYTTSALCAPNCNSYDCTATGCVVVQGTGGMFASMGICESSCESYNCTFNGCIPEPNYGSGGTYSQDIYGVNAVDCNNVCDSWNCTDDGCIQYNTLPGPTFIDGLGGTGGTYDNSSCDFVCISYICEDNGCEQYNFGAGTGGTFTGANMLSDCQSICKSWDCGPSSNGGCFAYNGGDGTGGTYTVQSNCTSACITYNCQPTGCALVTGNDGTWPNLPNCLGGCESWNCTQTGCSQYNVLGSTTYTNGSGGTAGMYGTNGLCDTDCKSWDCTNTGCEQYNVVGSSANWNNNQGTGGTYTVLGYPFASTCDNTCESWDCAYVQPQTGFAWSATDGCTWHTGTGYQYSSIADCHTGCTSWTCVGLGASQGCTEFPNTASTYTDYTACTASTVCAYYECTLIGCVLRPGEYNSGIDTYLTEAACEAACVGWGCVTDLLGSATTIYVYYDTTEKPGLPSPAYTYGSISNQRTYLQDYISTNFPTWSGTMYHTIVSDGNWLDWSNSIYHNEFRVAPGNPANPAGAQVPSDNWDENAVHIIKYFNDIVTSGNPLHGNWYDQYSAGTYTNIQTSSANPDTATPTGVITSLTTQGIAPTAHTSGDTYVINFLQKAIGIELNPDVNGYHSGTISSGTIPYMTGQPTTAWTTDYTAHTTNYNAVTANTGTLRGMVFPLWAEGNTSDVDVNRMFTLHALAAVRPGNNIPQDGIYQVGTAPQLPPHQNVGGIGTDFNMSQIEVMNPYWNSTTATYGNLEAKGWAVGLGVIGNYCPSVLLWPIPAPSCMLGNSLYLFGLDIDNHLQQTSPAVGTCISAETLYTINTTYPHELEGDCNTLCAPQYYSCTHTGCTLSWTGTMSLIDCQAVCTSVSCTTNTNIGCETYNAPGSLSESNGLYGTGGTFTGANMLSDCQSQCFSYGCDPVVNYALDEGCQQYLGTGQTYVSYNSCTGSCRSWHCDDPCVTNTNNVSTGLGCVEYLNTGATHLTYNSCTGVCQENWYCTTASTIDSCDGAAFSTITSGDIDDHINKLASTPSWNNQLFQGFKFLYITTPTNATNTCYSGSPANAYWSKVNSISISLNSNIPVSTVAYTWNDVTAFISTYYPTTVISTISDIENLGGVTITYNWELCSCVEIPCTIGCTNSQTIPVNTVGPHNTYAIAEADCCSGTTWSCATNTIIDNCDGLTLIPGLFTDVEGCYEWLDATVGTYGLNVTTLKCEVMPTVPLAQCELGPNYGQLIRLTGVTSSISAIAANTYTSLTSYVSALQGISVPNAQVGLPLDVLHDEVQLVYAGALVYYGWSDCECDNPYSCGCLELFDGTGPYTSKAECELSCCSATTWDCVNGTQYQPICGSKTHLGMTPDTTTLLEHFHLSSPTTLFGLNTWTISSNPTTPWVTVQNNMILAGGSTVWTDCYNYVGGLYWTTVHLYAISHPLINGGAPYQTWNDFYTVVNAVVGITLSSSDTIAGINTKINTHFATTVFNVIFDIKSCCSEDDCYCYDTLDSSGAHANELLCDSSCCPSTQMSWSCELDLTGSYGCTYGSYGPPINTSLPSMGPWATINDCQMLSLACSTSWECQGVTPNCDCVEVQGNYTVTGNYQTELECDNNTNINDCCGLPVTYTCDTGTISSNMTGLDNGMTAMTATTLGFPNLGYLTTDDVLTYIANPLTSPSNQSSAVTSFSFCLEESSQAILNNLPTHCKCGDGCNGVLHLATGFTFSHFNLGSTDINNAFNIVTHPQGYCTTWVEFIDQINIVWAPGIVSLTLAMTFQQVRNEIYNGIGVTQLGVGTTSCIDSSSPCGCIGNTLGIGVSLAACSLTCCLETTTYTCTIQGCKSKCDGSGEYQTIQECELECWEWRCNQDIWGCTDPTAFNYNPLATIDDGTCILPNDFWSCGMADDCSNKIPVSGGLSYTAAISQIAGNSSLHSVQLDTIKYDLGGGNNQNHPSGGNDHLPCDPCEVPGQIWGQPGPYYAYIKYVMYSGLGSGQFTTWSSFIDAINNLGYSFMYTNTWQDLEAVLGQTQIYCNWDWCDCSGAKTCIPDHNGNYVTSGQCYADTFNDCTSWKCNSTYVETCSGTTTYMGPYTNFDNASNDYVGTYPLLDLSNFTFSVATIPLSNTGYWVTAGIPPCTPPVGPMPVPLSMFPLLTWTGITINSTSTLAGSMLQLTFTSWLDLITAINAAGTTIPTQGATTSTVISLGQDIAGAGYANQTNGQDLISFEWFYCMCGYINCDCIEVPDGTGPYPSMACCEDDESDDNCCHKNWDCPTTP